ncbi:MAG: dolichol kinase [Bacteroidetes bacterium]|nr:dolichol kinase [Bacteroidota bacterium]
MIELQSVETSYSSELIRKGIHLCSLSIPVIYYYISKDTALSILIPLTLAFGLTDLARLFLPSFRGLYHRFFGFLLRNRERNTDNRRLNGATYVLLSATLCVWLFPKVIVITAFAILIVSDSAAALIGRRFGRHPFFGKTREGTTAFLVTALLVVLLAPKILYLPTEYLIGALAALIGTFVELLSGDLIDDNLSIPLSISLVMWGLYILLLPTINVFALEGAG